VGRGTIRCNIPSSTFDSSSLLPEAGKRITCAGRFQGLLKSKRCCHLVVFAADVKDARQKARIEKLGRQVSWERGFLKRSTPANKRYDAVIEVLTVHSAARQETTIFDFPAVFRPWDERDGWNYWKIFVDDQSYHEGHGHVSVLQR
jgi:phenol 2-monooxygenase